MQLGFDVFNALDLMHNGEVLKDLKFGIGDGNLQVCSYICSLALYGRVP
jgi:glycylpeptide N-tetradecanoyltransferase